MDYYSSHDYDLFSPAVLITVAVALLILMFIYDRLTKGRSDVFDVYGYEDYNGPTVWKKKYVSAAGNRQSPVNLQERCAIAMPSETVPPLVFSREFHTPPSLMKLCNSGHTVFICPLWRGGKRPIVHGGPLEEEYRFLNIRFRWGPNDDEGSEHMINSMKYAMELQASFVKNCSDTDDVIEAAKCGDLLVMAYLFSITPRDNPYMEPIVNSLHSLKYPMSCVCIEPVILSLLMPTFARDYYYYTGSLTYPPCIEGVKWIVKPEPLMISSCQVKKFRKLYGNGIPMLNNSRPVQKITNRDIFFYD